MLDPERKTNCKTDRLRYPDVKVRQEKKIDIVTCQERRPRGFANLNEEYLQRRTMLRNS